MMFDNRCHGNNEYHENMMGNGNGYEYENNMAYEHKMPYEANMMGSSCHMPGMVCPPVYECPRENCVHRTIMHEVPHIQNINTKVINHHVYRHTYTPCFTMSEIDTCENVYDGCPR